MSIYLTNKIIVMLNCLKVSLQNNCNLTGKMDKEDEIASKFK